MEQMRHTRKQIDGVTPHEIEQFIATKTDIPPHALDMLDDKLLRESPSMGSQPLEKTLLYQQARKAMRDYVGRVRGCLEGQS
jgi:hypothetical protein